MSRRSNNAAGFFNLGGYKEGCADGVVSGWDSAMARADRVVEIGEEVGRLEDVYISCNDEWEYYTSQGYPYGAPLFWHRRCLSIVRKTERLVDEVIRLKRGEG